jgi:hypothetical protein
LLNLALHKIKARIEDLNGGHNPIINLDDSWLKLFILILTSEIFNESIKSHQL